MRIIPAAIALLVIVCLQTGSALAKSPSLIGTWHGKGLIQPKTGEKEKTRCRAEIQKSPARGQYTAKYRCSSPYGLILQDVIVKRTSRNHYTGSFDNPQHKISGSITIILDGDEQTVTMKSDDGQGWLSMKKR